MITLRSLWYYRHEAVFKHEFSTFSTIRDQPPVFAIDPGWLALLLAVLTRSCMSLFTNSAFTEQPRRYGVHSAHPPVLSQKLFEALETSLTAARWLSRPQVRILQALLIMTPQNCRDAPASHFAEFETQARRVSWSSIAISIAKQLGLRRMRRGIPKALQDDLALPREYSLYTQQICSRLFAQILFSDTISCCSLPATVRRYSPFAFPSDSYDTLAPGNYPEEALWNAAEETDSTAALDGSQITAYVWEWYLCRLTLHVRSIVAISERHLDMALDAVAQCDQDIRIDYVSFLRLKAVNDLSGRESYHWFLVSSAYNFRILQLHRSWLCRSQLDPKYAFSQTQAMDAATQILRTQEHLFRQYASEPSLADAFFLFVHHLAADIAVFAHSLRQDHNRARWRRELSSSRQLLLRESARLQRMENGGLRWIKALDIMLDMLREDTQEPHDIPKVLERLKARLAQPDEVCDHTPVSLPEVENIMKGIGDSSRGDSELGPTLGAERRDFAEFSLRDDGSSQVVLPASWLGWDTLAAAGPSVAQESVSFSQGPAPMGYTQDAVLDMIFPFLVDN